MILPYFHLPKHTSGPVLDTHRALAEELRRDVVVLASDIGPRNVSVPARYQLAQQFIAAALKGMGYEVARQVWTASDVECANLEVVIPGTDRSERILVVGAHYDSIENCPAANDNGSGVAGVLALARRFRNERYRCTIRLVFFANEEPPFFNLDQMGSQIYARRCKAKNEDIVGMYCLETIGCYSDLPNSQSWPEMQLPLSLPLQGNFIAFVGTSEANDLLRRSVEAFEAAVQFPCLAAGIPAGIAQQVEWSDHRGFNEMGYPAFMITDTAPLRYKHYHEPTDTPDKIDYVSMARVVDGVAGMTRRLANEL